MQISKGKLRCISFLVFILLCFVYSFKNLLWWHSTTYKMIAFESITTCSGECIRWYALFELMGHCENIYSVLSCRCFSISLKSEIQIDIFYYFEMKCTSVSGSMNWKLKRHCHLFNSKDKLANRNSHFAHSCFFQMCSKSIPETL